MIKLYNLSKLTISIFLCLPVLSQSIIGFKSLEEVKEIRKKAIYRVEVVKNGIPKAIATAFAVSKDGHLVTVSHIFDDSKDSNGNEVIGYRSSQKKKGPSGDWQVRIVSNKGKVAIVSPDSFICDESKFRIDVCIFTIDRKVRSYVSLDDDHNVRTPTHVNPFTENNSHMRYFTYGNPPDGKFKPLEYRLVRNHIDPKGNIWTRSFSTRYNKMIHLLDLIEMPKRKSTIGYSGAPLLDSRGKIAGMLSERWVRDVKDKYVGHRDASMAIAVSYIKGFYLDNVDKLTTKTKKED